jgi:hypothetical protein
MLIALLISAAAASRPPKELGYPIFVQIEDGHCAYGIQDMIIKDPKDVTDWIRRSLLIGRVDIVTNEKTPDQCVEIAKSALVDAGHSNIVVRRGTEAEYGGVGPPH